MQLKQYTSGSTIKLKCTFKDFNNVKVDPSLVKLIIYNYKYEKQNEYIVTSKGDIGEYYHHFITPSKSQTFYYEWYGEIDGLPSIIRSGFITKFM